MNYYKAILILFLFFSYYSLAQKKILVKENETTIETISLLIDKDTITKKSGIGFIRKTQAKNNLSKIVVDTCFSSNSIALDNIDFQKSEYFVRKNKFNIPIHYLIYNRDCFRNFHDKDSIPLWGYFKMYDYDKPHSSTIYEQKGYEPSPEDDILRTIRNEPFDNTEGFFKDGLKEGKWIFKIDSFYGFSRIEEFYKGGIRNGLYSVFNKDNKIIYQSNFIKGSGIEKLYYPNGNIYHIKYFKNGTVDYSKPYKVYYDNGNIARIYDYPKNKTTYYYYENNTISSSRQVKYKGEDLISNAEYNMYDKSGTLREKSYFEDGVPIYEITYNSKGKITYISSGNMVQYFKRGKLKNIEIKTLLSD